MRSVGCIKRSQRTYFAKNERGGLGMRWLLVMLGLLFSSVCCFSSDSKEEDCLPLATRDQSYQELEELQDVEQGDVSGSDHSLENVGSHRSVFEMTRIPAPFARQHASRPRLPSLTRSLSHPDRLSGLTEEVDAQLGLDVHEELESAVANPTIAALRLLAQRTKEANHDRREHERLVAQHLKESKLLAERAEARSLAAEKRASRARKLAIILGVGQAVATVGGWVWSSGFLHRWLGWDDGTDGGDS